MASKVFKGVSSKEGSLMINGVNEFVDYLKSQKGKRLMIRIDSFDKGATAAQIGFYYGKTIPDVQEAFRQKGDWKSLKEVDGFLRSQCSITVDESRDGKFTKRLKSLDELSKEQMMEYFEWIRIYIIENLGVFSHHILTI